MDGFVDDSERKPYSYRGIYDSGEVPRIQNLLDDQRRTFNKLESPEKSFEEKAKRYGIIVLGGAVLLLGLRIIIKKS